MKFRGVKLAGGIELNGREIYEDGERDLENIRQRMQLEYETPPLDLYWLITNGIKSLFSTRITKEQRLVQSLINEQLQIYGVDVYTYQEQFYQKR